jgi:hypothetical protein
MEDVLDVYARPYDVRHPVVGMDELPVHLVDHTRPLLPPAPGPAGSSALRPAPIRFVRRSCVTRRLDVLCVVYPTEQEDV